MLLWIDGYRWKSLAKKHVSDFASGGSFIGWDAGVGVGCSRCSGEWGEVRAAVRPTPAFPNVGSFLIKPEAQ